LGVRSIADGTLEKLARTMSEVCGTVVAISRGLAFDEEYTSAHGPAEHICAIFHK